MGYKEEIIVNIFTKPLFWIGIYLIGYMTVIIVFSFFGMLTRIENKIPKPIIRFFILMTFIAPPVALPFTEGPKIAIPTPAALITGIILLVMNFYIKVASQKQIGVIPALKSKAKLITTGIYGIVRNPLYISNWLLALGMAILFKSMCGLLFSIPYCLLYLPIIYFEEKDLLKKYGREFEKYKIEIPWKMIPKIF